MSTLLSWVLAATASLAPGRSHEPLAQAIVTVAEREAPLFRDDDDRKKTVAFLVAVAFRESSLRADVVGDRVGKEGTPTSFCAFQIHLPWWRKTAEGWSPEDLTQEPEKCVTVAHRMMHESARACPEHPLAWYAEGPQGCTSARAQRISRDRMALAQRLLKEVTPTPGASDQDQDATRAEPSGREDAKNGREPSETRPRNRPLEVVARGYATPGPRHMCRP